MVDATVRGRPVTAGLFIFPNCVAEIDLVFLKVGPPSAAKRAIPIISSHTAFLSSSILV